MLHDERTGMSALCVVYSHPYVSHLSGHEEVFVDSDVTVCISLHYAYFLMERIQDVLLWICDDWSLWRYENPLSGSDLAFAVLVVEQVNIDRYNLYFEEVLYLCSIVAPRFSCLHTLGKPGRDLQLERICRLTERYYVPIKFMHHVAQKHSFALFLVMILLAFVSLVNFECVLSLLKSCLNAKGRYSLICIDVNHSDDRVIRIECTTGTLKSDRHCCILRS